MQCLTSKVVKELAPEAKACYPLTLYLYKKNSIICQEQLRLQGVANSHRHGRPQAMSNICGGDIDSLPPVMLPLFGLF